MFKANFDSTKICRLLCSVSCAAIFLSPRLFAGMIGPIPMDYTTIQHEKLKLYAWTGQKTAILTKRNDLDPAVMQKMVTVADGVWNYYASVTGAVPKPHVTYQGLASIAQVTTTCGAGCTYVGSTGMELTDPTFNWLYSGLQKDVYDQVLFYEMGRSFWLFGKQLEYAKPDNADCIVTGYAVLMRYRSMGALGLTGSMNGTPEHFAKLYQATLGLADQYDANPARNWSNTFLANSFSGVENLGCPDLFTSLMYRLIERYGGEQFLQSFYREVLREHAVSMTQDAVDNFAVAASTAARHNLTLVFRDEWRWNISASAARKIQSKWGVA